MKNLGKSRSCYSIYFCFFYNKKLPTFFVNTQLIKKYHYVYTWLSLVQHHKIYGVLFNLLKLVCSILVISLHHCHKYEISVLITLF